MTQPGRKDDCGKPNDWVILVKQSSKGMDGAVFGRMNDAADYISSRGKA
jgi:hypothetical protein